MMYCKSILAAMFAASQGFALAGCNESTRYLISFGDSYSQTGFNVDGERPSAQNPIGNPPLPGWTASGGLDWPGYMVTGFNRSLTLAYNFAYGGATVDASLIAPYQPSVRSLVDQVAQFSGSIAARPAYAPWDAGNAVFGVWMGINDVGNSFWLQNIEDVLGKTVRRYFDQLQIMYDAGARQFAILNVPPTDKTPTFLMADAWSREHLQSAIALFNKLVAEGLSAFEASNQGVTAKIIDTAVPFNKAIANPTAYGAPDATCFNSNGVSCLWFDNYHPGTAIQRLVAAAVAEAWSGFFKS